MKRNFESKSIKNILGKLIDSSSNLNSGLNNIKVQKLWKEVMGSNVNSYTNEVVLKNKTLYVNLNSSCLDFTWICSKKSVNTMYLVQ